MRLGNVIFIVVVAGAALYFIASAAGGKGNASATARPTEQATATRALMTFEVTSCLRFVDLESTTPYAYQVRIRNNSGQVVLVSPNQIRALGPLGQRYIREAWPTSHLVAARKQTGRDELLALNLAPGESVEGWVLFATPASEFIDQLIFEPAANVKLNAVVWNICGK